MKKLLSFLSVVAITMTCVLLPLGIYMLHTDIVMSGFATMSVGALAHGLNEMADHIKITIS